ncbi:MAG: hypothetical protein ACKVOE_03710 [Rickettsiales bacterium]
MRKQYHFRKSERGLLAWDVDRLIMLSKAFPIIDVPLTKIKELDENYWFDADGGEPTCRAIAQHATLIQAVDLSFPVILLSNGRVADGMHRICRAWMEGLESIKAVRFASDPEPDYVGMKPEDLPY